GQFFSLAARLEQDLASSETLLCNVSAERSDFIRFNKALVRQAGSVAQCYLTLRLLSNRRQASATLALAASDDDLADAREALASLRTTLRELPEDPWLLINENPQSGDAERRGKLAPPAQVVAEGLGAAHGRDRAGPYAGGTSYRGFANSPGQRNWHDSDRS